MMNSPLIEPSLPINDVLNPSIDRLTQENENLRRKLAYAQQIIGIQSDVQKRLCELMGLLMEAETP